MMAFLTLALAASSGPATEARALSPDSGPFAYVDESGAGMFQPAGEPAFAARAVFTYADVIAVAPAPAVALPGVAGVEAPTGVRIYDVTTRAKRGESTAGTFAGMRGDDGAFVLQASAPGGAHTTTYVNAKGKTVRAFPRSCVSFFEKRAACRVWGVGRGWLEHYVDDKGNEIMPALYWQTQRFRGGEAIVAFHAPPGPAGGEPELWFTLIDKKGKPRFRPAYKALSPFKEDRAWVEAADDPAHRGFIDRNGVLKVTVAPDESADAFSSGVAVVRGPSGERVINKDGKTILRIPLPFRIYGSFVGMRGRLVGDVRSGSALVSLDGSVSDVPELWTTKGAWPAKLGKPPEITARPRDMNYQTLDQVTKRAADPQACADAAASMIAISKGADPEAWVAAERCARLGGDDARAADAHAAYLYVASLDPGVKRTQAAWTATGGRIGPQASGP